MRITHLTVILTRHFRSDSSPEPDAGTESVSEPSESSELVVVLPGGRELAAVLRGEG
jgi:hypothetical protein